MKFLKNLTVFVLQQQKFFVGAAKAAKRGFGSNQACQVVRAFELVAGLHQRLRRHGFDRLMQSTTKDIPKGVQVL